jgi:hypothetical protein
MMEEKRRRTTERGHLLIFEVIYIVESSDLVARRLQGKSVQDARRSGGRLFLAQNEWGRLQRRNWQ